jgi:hypothetical protein
VLVVDRLPFGEVSDFVPNQHVYHDHSLSVTLSYRFNRTSQSRLKYCTARSCFSTAARRVLNVPRFLRFPVFGFFFPEYNR